LNCKIYCYEFWKICDLVFEIKDFGVVVIAEYPIDGEWLKENWDSLDQYESGFNCKWNKTYIGSVVCQEQR